MESTFDSALENATSPDDEADKIPSSSSKVSAATSPNISNGENEKDIKVVIEQQQQSQQQQQPQQQQRRPTPEVSLGLQQKTIYSGTSSALLSQRAALQAELYRKQSKVGEDYQAIVPELLKNEEGKRESDCEMVSR
jgi:hypothetical protein